MGLSYHFICSGLEVVDKEHVLIAIVIIVVSLSIIFGPDLSTLLSPYPRLITQPYSISR